MTIRLTPLFRSLSAGPSTLYRSGSQVAHGPPVSPSPLSGDYAPTAYTPPTIADTSPVNPDDKRVINGMTDINQLAPFKYPWAWNYFLIRWRPKEYTAYLKMLSKKRRLVWDGPETRLAEFNKFFGPDLETLEADFLKRMSRLK